MNLLAAVRTWLRSLPVRTVDTAIAVAIFVLCTLSLVVADPTTATAPQPADAFAFVLIAAMTLTVAVRRRYPVVVFVVVCVAMSLYEILGYGGINVDFFGPIVALYSVIVYGPRRFGPWAPVLAFTAIMASAPFVMAPDTSLGSFVTQSANVAAIVGLVWFLSDTVRTRREQATELAAKNAELEAARDELAHQAVADERVRIARELHDVVAHSMSVIAVQSGMGRMVIATQPDEAAKALASIEETSRSSLHEMRRILSVLRSEDQTEGSLAPAPTLLDLDHLIDQTRAVGVDVDLEVTGERGSVPVGVDLSAYRIVQEALTNVIKHARATRARVTVAYEPASVAVEVVDDGRGAAALATVGARGAPVRSGHPGPDGSSALAGSIDGGGNGLVGMRERAAVYGGEVEAGPVTGGGFRVRARLPFDGGRS